jgi:hypothetical protein
VGDVWDYIERVYGVSLYEVEAFVVLAPGAPAAPILPNNPNRFAYEMFNLGAGVAYAAFTVAVSPVFGMQLDPLGGGIGMSVKDDGNVPTRGLFGFSPLGATIYYFEILSQGKTKKRKYKTRVKA